MDEETVRAMNMKNESEVVRNLGSLELWLITTCTKKGHGSTFIGLL